MFDSPWKMRYTALALAALLVCAPTVFGQATTGSLSGLVTDESGDTALPGAVITAVHTPTGTRYNTVSRADGRFRILNVRVGGPYTLAASMDGFQTTEQTGVLVKLGDDTAVDFHLKLQEIEETLVVVAESSPLINPTRMGSTSNVDTHLVESLPNISRGIEELARTNPFFSVTASGDGQGSLTVAGRNNRFNNIQIDGAVNNDLFGLAATGTPGGQAESQPISLDAIEELQLLVTPFDVRQGGFSGGGVNAITKSGTNRWGGTAYYFDRDDGLIGDRQDSGGNDVPFGDFSDTQYGVSVSGPIAKDKAFFFVNFDTVERSRPTGFSADGSSGQTIDALADLTTIRQFTIDNYGFDPGGFGESSRDTNSDKIFARLDFNLTESHQLTLRHNYVDADNDVLRPNQFNWEFSSHNYQFLDETNSTVVQLNSVFGPNTFNELRLSYQTIRDDRAGAKPFPYVRIDDVGVPQNVDVELGTERFSTANALDQDILEINNDFTILKGNHTLTFGTHNELFSFDNLFIRENFGSYRFRGGLEQYLTGIADEYNFSFSSDPNDPKRSAKFDVNQLGFYAGDQWAAKSNLTLTFGLRVDIPLFPDTPTANPQSLEFGFRTDDIPDGNEIFSPRFGFNWDITKDGRNQLRGGLGLFSGRAPYVWLSNQYSNTGIEFTRIQVRGSIPFNPDPNNQPTSIPGARAFTNEIDLVNPDFEFPQVFRISLGYYRQFDFLGGVVGSVEAILSETEQDIVYRDLNTQPTGVALGLDGRSLFARANRDFTNVILLDNTTKGEQTNLAIKLERPFKDNWTAFVSYAYGDSDSVNDGTSSQAVSNWRFLPTVDPNNPQVARSNFLVRHRFNALLSYTADWGHHGWASTFSLFYNDQSGRPYSTTFNRDVNGDFQSNDLIYVNQPGEVAVVFNNASAGSPSDPVAEAAWEAYIDSDAGLSNARGSIVGRNASFAPWSQSLDFRFAQDLPIKGRKFQVTFDVENLLNLIDSDKGHVRFVPFSEISPVELLLDGDGQPRLAADGRPLYRLRISDPDTKFTTDNLRSRWRARVGLRFTY